MANPLGAILSAAMLLRHSFGLETEALVIESAVSAVLNAGYRTADLADSATPASMRVGTRGMGEKVLERLKKN
jgi:3-isopropylmalate dehydrogenase